MPIPATPGTAPGHQPAGDQQDSPGQVVIQPAGRGPATWALGSLFEHLAGAGQTGGQLGAAVVSQPAGAASPLHLHTREAEAFYVTGRRDRGPATDRTADGLETTVQRRHP